MAVIVGMGGQPKLVHDEFDIMELEQPAVRELIKRVDATLRDNGEERRNIILAALAELSAQYLDSTTTTKLTTDTKRGGDLVSSDE